MRKRDIIKLLRSDQDEHITRISREFPGMTDEQSEHLYQRIRKNAAPPKAPPEYRPHPIRMHRRTLPEHSLYWVQHAAVAASCVIVFGGTFAGLFWLKSHAPSVPADSERLSTADTIPFPDAAASLGKPYAADNMTASGTLWVMVTDACFEKDLCRVTVTLKSDDAVSLAADTMDEPELYFAENFRLSDGSMTLSPCRFVTDGKTGDLPYTLLLPSDSTCTLTLWYSADPSGHWQLVTGNTPGQSRTDLKLEDTP